MAASCRRSEIDLWSADILSASGRSTQKRVDESTLRAFALRAQPDKMSAIPRN
jgi:hypothetical protein